MGSASERQRWALFISLVVRFRSVLNPAAARILTRQSGNLPGAGSVPAHHASTGRERAKPLHRLPLSPTHRRSPPTSTATLHQRALRCALAASARPAQVGASAQGGRRRLPKLTARAPRAALAHAPPPPPPRGHSPHRPRHAALRRAPQCRRGLEPARAQGERRVSAHLLSCERCRGSRAAPRRRRAPAAAPPGPCRSRGGRSAGEAGTWPRAQRCPQLRSSALVYYLHRRCWADKTLSPSRARGHARAVRTPREGAAPWRCSTRSAAAARAGGPEAEVKKKRANRGNKEAQLQRSTRRRLRATPASTSPSSGQVDVSSRQ